MARDPRKLRVFQLADELAHQVYDRTAVFDPDERFGLRSQIRRAASSIPTNLSEGCGRNSTGELLYFVGVATGSAYEVRYLVGFLFRRGLIRPDDHADLAPRVNEVISMLLALQRALAPTRRRENERADASP